LVFSLTNIFGQSEKKTSAYFFTQYNKTLKDLSKENNPWSLGIGFQLLVNNKTKFKPAIEVTGDLYLEDDKVLRTDASGTPLNDLGEMVNLFVGTIFIPAKNIYVSFMLGPSFLGGETHFGIKPSVGFFFPKNRQWTAKLSYIDIFNRDKESGQDFTSVSIAVGVKLF
jgi:hypothetical protein